MARAKKRDNDRWMMRRWGKQNENEKKIADEEGGIVELKSTMKTVENEEDLFGSDDEGLRRPRRGIESDEEMEFEQVFEDDEEELPDDANPIDEENAEVVETHHVGERLSRRSCLQIDGSEAGKSADVDRRALRALGIPGLHAVEALRLANLRRGPLCRRPRSSARL